ncbi:hypothetical protein [Pandoravirus japonicus]|uniref:Uncharacterized protein n=1 Tax=Pandoravirus japonicus TaxID=2823154 RepID=A0A811BRC7_9VIRU|nr:hypothetical protein [Pandoravirus japonicus]
MNNDSADASAARRISLKRSREAPRAAAPVLIDLLSDDDGDLVVGADARAPTLAHRVLAVGDRRAPLAADYNSEDEDDEDDEDEMENSEDSDDPDDNGSDLDGFIVSDSDEDEDDGTSNDGGASEKKKKSAATDDQDSEAEFVPRDDLDDDPDDDDDDTVSSHMAHRDTSSSSPIVTIGSDDDDDGQDDDDKPHRDGAAAAAEAGDDGDEARPSKRARLDDAEVSSVDPGNIVSGKRCRRTTERYMDRHFMEFMVRDVPPSQIAAVFDDEDEYFQSGVSLTDSSDDDDDDDGDGDDGGSRDLDSSDYEDMDALSSSRARRRRRGDAAPALPVRALASPTGSASVDLSRPPSTVAALLRSLAAQPGGIRPSVASPRSAPTSRVRPPP